MFPSFCVPALNRILHEKHVNDLLQVLEPHIQRKGPDASESDSLDAVGDWFREKQYRKFRTFTPLRTLSYIVSIGRLHALKQHIDRLGPEGFEFDLSDAVRKHTRKLCYKEFKLSSPYEDELFLSSNVYSLLSSTLEGWCRRPLS